MLQHGEPINHIAAMRAVLPPRVFFTLSIQRLWLLAPILEGPATCDGDGVHENGIVLLKHVRAADGPAISIIRRL